MHGGDDGDDYGDELELTDNPLDVVVEVLGSVPAVALVRVLLCHLLLLVRGALLGTSAQVKGLDATEEFPVPFPETLNFVFSSKIKTYLLKTIQMYLFIGS